MPNPPRRPNPVELRRQADELHERSSALPDIPIQKRGYGGAGRIPPAKPPPLPLAVKSSPEATIVDVAPPAPGSAPMPPAPLDTLKGLGPRSLSPPPGSRPEELAPSSSPGSVHDARRHARQIVADQEARERAELAAARLEFEAARKAAKPTDYKGIAILVTALGGVAATIVAARSAPVPPGVLDCPARLDEVERKLKKTTATADDTETGLVEAKKAWRKTDDKAEDALDEVAKLRKLVPRVEGLKPE